VHQLVNKQNFDITTLFIINPICTGLRFIPDISVSGQSLTPQAMPQRFKVRKKRKAVDYNKFPFSPNPNVCG
jgi:hypothetical protein